MEERVRAPRAELRAGLLPHLAPAPRLGAADFHRREPARPGQPVTSQPLRGCPGQGLLPARPAGQPNRSFRGLLEHLATLTRNQVRFTGTTATVPMLAEPTSAQQQAFEFIGAAIPLTLK